MQEPDNHSELIGIRETLRPFDATTGETTTNLGEVAHDQPQNKVAMFAEREDEWESFCVSANTKIHCANKAKELRDAAHAIK